MLMRVGPLLREPRVVDGEDPAAHGQSLAQPAPERAGLPRRMRDEVLQPLVVARIAQPPMHRLHGLPFAVVEQSLHVPTRVRAMRSPTKAAGELIEKRPEPLHRLRVKQRLRAWYIAPGRQRDLLKTENEAFQAVIRLLERLTKTKQG